MLHHAAGPSFSANYSYKWLRFLFEYLSVFQSYCSSRLIIIHSNLFEVDILGLADLAGDIFIKRGKRHLMCIEIALISSYQL